MPLGMVVGLGPGDFVFDGDLAPPENTGTTPTQFLAHVYCGQTAGWINMPLGLEVNGPGDVVLDEVAAPRPQRGRAPQFLVHVYCSQTAGCMKTPLCTEVDLVPDHIVLVQDPALLRKEHSSPPLFGPCLLWPWSPMSATAELLLHCSRRSVHILYNGTPFPLLKIALYHGWIWNPSNTRFLGPTRVLNPDGISIGSPFLLGSLLLQTDRRSTPSVTMDRIYTEVVMQCGLIIFK